MGRNDHLHLPTGMPHQVQDRTESPGVHREFRLLDDDERRSGTLKTAASSPSERNVPSDILNDSKLRRFLSPHSCVNSRESLLPCLMGFTRFVLGTMVASNSPIRAMSSGEPRPISCKTLATLLPSALMKPAVRVLHLAQFARLDRIGVHRGQRSQHRRELGLTGHHRQCRRRRIQGWFNPPTFDRKFFAAVEAVTLTLPSERRIVPGRPRSHSSSCAGPQGVPRR